MSWTIQPDTEPDAEPPIHAMMCAVCHKQSGGRDELAEAQDWALDHAGRHPTHHSYRELTVTPWKAWMRNPQG
ncbi:MAG: hypothetical protein ACRDP3_25455 [Streptomyces sp.]|uniref:DUF7848 domain-containing protein n=1 Tax=Streptomyces sp. TaxID=1931 RepID=UPI003D6A2B0C